MNNGIDAILLLTKHATYQTDLPPSGTFIRLHKLIEKHLLVVSLEG